MKNQIRKRLLLILMAGLLILITGCSEPSADAENDMAASDAPVTITLGGASTSGMMFIICSGISECVNKSYPGSSVTIVPGSSAANVIRINAGELDVATTHAVVLHSAANGTAPYDEKMDNAAAIASFYSSTYQIVIDKSLGISSFGEIIEKKVKIRISVDQQGSAASLAFDKLLEAYGVTREEFEAWGGSILLKTQSESASMLADGAIDAYGLQTLWPATAIQENAVAKDIALLPIEAAIVRDLTENYGYAPITIPTGTYDFLDEDYATFSTSTVLIVPADSSEDTAYKLTRSLVENIEYMNQVHAGLNGLTAERMMQDTGVPLHPGALKYYKEKGVLE